VALIRGAFKGVLKGGMKRKNCELEGQQATGLNIRRPPRKNCGQREAFKFDPDARAEQPCMEKQWGGYEGRLGGVAGVRVAWGVSICASQQRVYAEC